MEPEFIVAPYSNGRRRRKEMLVYGLGTMLVMVVFHSVLLVSGWDFSSNPSAESLNHSPTILHDARQLFGLLDDGDTTITCNKTSSLEIDCNGTLFHEVEPTVDGWQRWVDILICVGLVLFAGMMSGLTMGLLSLDIVNLQIVMRGGEPDQAAYARKILPLVRRHHLLLVTLLLGNSLAMEALPIFLDRLVPAYMAIIMSVTFVLFFGEIIPQAICTRFGLAIGAYTAWLVWGLIVLFFVIAWPISKLLDCVLGHDTGAIYRRAEMKAMVDVQQESSADNPHGLTKDEATIIKGAIDLKEKKVKDIMTPIDRVSMIDFDSVMDYHLLRRLTELGHSRFPVYRKNRDNIIGMLLVKKLILVSPNDNTPVSAVPLVRLPNVPASLPLYSILDLFQTGRSHMAMVVDDVDHVSTVGVITLEDVVEELIQEEIYDEKDKTPSVSTPHSNLGDSNNPYHVEMQNMQSSSTSSASSSSSNATSLFPNDPPNLTGSNDESNYLPPPPSGSIRRTRTLTKNLDEPPPLSISNMNISNSNISRDQHQQQQQQIQQQQQQQQQQNGGVLIVNNPSNPIPAGRISSEKYETPVLTNPLSQSLSSSSSSSSVQMPVGSLSANGNHSSSSTISTGNNNSDYGVQIIPFSDPMVGSYAGSSRSIGAPFGSDGFSREMSLSDSLSRSYRPPSAPLLPVSSTVKFSDLQLEVVDVQSGSYNSDEEEEEEEPLARRKNPKKKRSTSYLGNHNVNNTSGGTS